MTSSPFRGRGVKAALYSLVSAIANANILLRILDLYTRLLGWFHFVHMQSAIAKWHPTIPYVKYAETANGIDITVPVRYFYNCSPMTHSLIYDLEDYLIHWGVENPVKTIVLRDGTFEVSCGEITYTQITDVGPMIENVTSGCIRPP